MQRSFSVATTHAGLASSPVRASFDVLDRLVLVVFNLRHGLTVETFAAYSPCHTRRRPHLRRAETHLTRGAPCAPTAHATSFVAVREAGGSREPMHEALPEDGWNDSPKKARCAQCMLHLLRQPSVASSRSAIQVLRAARVHHRAAGRGGQGMRTHVLQSSVSRE